MRERVAAQSSWPIARGSGPLQALVWYRAPEEGKDIALALRDFAVQMERQLPGLTMVHVVDSIDTLRDWLPRLTESLERIGILLVLDNLESLLTTTGQWRDERWGLLIGALLTPGGLSRAVLTSRTRPADLQFDRNRCSACAAAG